MKKAKKFEWTPKCEAAFQTLKDRLTSTLVLTLPSKTREFSIYDNVAKHGLCCILMQYDKVIAHASCQAKSYEKNYPTNNI